MSKTDQITTENATGEELAQLDEEMRARVQMQDIERSTVEPGKIMVPVKAVATSEDNERVAITVEHPIDDEVMFRLEKPRTWDPENELVAFLQWYDLSINGIYQLQTHDICIERYEGRVKGWELCEPPSYTPPHTERVQSRLPEVPESYHVVAFAGIMGVMMSVGLVASTGQYLTPEPVWWGAAIVGAGVGAAGCLVAMVIIFVFGEVRPE